MLNKLKIDECFFDIEDMSFIHQNLEVFLRDVNLYQDTQKKLIKQSFEYHMENNENYKNYVHSWYENYDEIKFDINKIPLIPSSFFKINDLDMHSVSKNEIEKYCTSSGTLGNLSIVPRDEKTLINFYSSISATLSAYFDLERVGNYKVFVLGPNPDEAGDLWFSYVLASMAINFQSEYLESNNVFNYKSAYSQIKKATDSGYEIILIGPPFRILELCEYIKENFECFKLNGNSIIISAGGWKNQQRKYVPKEMYFQNVQEVFNIEKSSIRDSFNMVELNTVISECECHEKHLLPWIDVIARDPYTNEPLPDNEVGILSFYDASSLSFPCFILSEDYGSIQSEICKCGRVTKRINIVRRMNQIETRGCALKMAAGKSKNGRAENQDRFFISRYRVNS